jgi:hypothetical protein
MNNYTFLILAVLFLFIYFIVDSSDLFLLNDHSTIRPKSLLSKNLIINDVRAPPFDASLVDCSKHSWSRREKPAILFDGFLFNGELDILRIRLSELDEIVDYFVVLEASMTFRQIPKNTAFFNETGTDFFFVWGDKLVYKFVDTLPVGLLVSKTESFIRSKLSDAFIETSKSSKLSAINLEDVIVVVSDVDEVPCADKLAWLKYCDIPSDALPARMELEYFYYYNFMWKKNCKLKFSLR